MVTIGSVTVPVILCVNSSNVSQPIPDVSTEVETFTIPSGDTAALFTLAKSLDFEATKEYDLLVEITDTASGLQGNITVKVKVEKGFFAL